MGTCLHQQYCEKPGRNLTDQTLNLRVRITNNVLPKSDIMARTTVVTRQTSRVDKMEGSSLI